MWVLGPERKTNNAYWFVSEQTSGDNEISCLAYMDRAMHTHRHMAWQHTQTYVDTQTSICPNTEYS